MSSFKISAIHKATGNITEVWCLDDYFGKHKYGYIPNTTTGDAMTEDQFYRQYEPKDASNG